MADEYVFKPASDAVASEVQKGLRERKALYQERNVVMHNIRRHRLMRQKVNLPRNWAKRLGGEMAPKVPLMYRLIQTAVTAVAKDFPRVQEEPLSVKDKSRADQSSRGWNLLLQTVDRQHKMRFLYNLYFKHFGDGMSVTKTLDGRWHGYPIQEDGESDSDYNDRCDAFKDDNPLPFYTSLVDPLTFFPPLDEYSEGPTVEIAWRSARDTFRRLNMMPEKGTERWAFRQIPDGTPYPEREFPSSLPPQVEVSEIWTPDYCAVISTEMGGDVWIMDNPTGERPYSWGYADPTGVDDPTNIGMSIAYPLYYIAPHIDSMVGLMMAWATFMAPTMYTTQQASPFVRPTAEMSTTNWEPGMLYNLPTGRDMRVVSAPDMGAPAVGFLNLMMGLADRGGLPPQIAGDISGSRLPALTLQHAFEAGLARLGPAVRSLEYVIGDTLSHMRRIIADYGEDIPVNGWEFADEDTKVQGWAKIEAKQCAKNRPFTVTLETQSIQDKIAMGVHSSFMGQAGIWSLRRQMRESGVRDPEEEMAEIGADKAMKIAQELQARKTIMEDPELGPLMQQMSGGGAPTPTPTAAGEGGPGRNRAGVPAGAGGGRRGGLATERPRGNRSSPVGRT